MKKIWNSNCHFNGHTYSATKGNGVVNLRANNKVFTTITVEEWENLFPAGSNEPSLSAISTLRNEAEINSRGY
jgi:hypothetical protein